MRTIIVAMAKNRAIGLNNQLPWHLPEDLKHFKEKTLNQTVIMGRKTFESLPPSFRPLPQRQNIILSHQNLTIKNVEIAHNFTQAFEKAKGEIFILGGASVYEASLNLVDCLEITLVDLQPHADSFFPPIHFNIWKCIKSEKHIAQNGIHFTFQTYLKKEK